MQLSIQCLNSFLNAEESQASAYMGEGIEPNPVVLDKDHNTVILPADRYVHVLGIRMACAIRQCLLNHAVDAGTLRVRKVIKRVVHMDGCRDARMP